jgi:hypothetical protein
MVATSSVGELQRESRQEAADDRARQEAGVIDRHNAVDLPAKLLQGGRLQDEKPLPGRTPERR